MSHEGILLKTILNEFERRNVRYFAIDGFAMGTQRHGGYFPVWEHDNDIGVQNEDVEKVWDVILYVKRADLKRRGRGRKREFGNEVMKS